MKRASYILFGIAAAAGTVILVSFSFGLFSGPELLLEDLLVFSKPVSEELVILAIDDESLQRLGQWPWPRALFGRALRALDQYPPAAVGIDVIFAETSRLGAADERALTAALENLSYPVVLPAEAVPLILESSEGPQAGRWVVPRAELTDSGTIWLGHVNLILDYDGVVRRFPTAIAFPSLRGRPVRSFAQEILDRAGRMITPALPDGAVERIVYSAPAGFIRRVPFWRLLEEGEKIQSTFKDKIVLVGAVAADLHDTKITPFSRGSEMSGVEIQANIVNMLLSGERIRDLGAGMMSLWIFAAALLPALFFVRWPGSLRPLGVNIGLGTCYTVAAVILFEQGVAADIIHLNAAWMLSTASLFGWRYFTGERERKEMRSIFGKYVSKNVLEDILRDPSKVVLGGQEKEITVLFSDIRGFTTLSERTAPTDLVRILNLYFSYMSAQVIAHDGVLDKYIGDAIMAFWGAPLDDPDHATHAFEAGLGMLEELKRLNADLRFLAEPEINIGIGIYTGPAVVGNIGSDIRHDYTVIGDTVNVASRLEGLNKEFGTNIIIGQSTRERIKGNYTFRSLGETSVKGRKEALRIYAADANIGQLRSIADSRG